MSRQLEQKSEDRHKRRDQATLDAVEGGLSAAIARSGGELLGFSVRVTPGECLLTIRVRLAGRKQVCFVGSEDLGAALRKACVEGRRDKLTWKADRYA